jgi:hypothetical protein
VDLLEEEEEEEEEEETWTTIKETTTRIKQQGRKRPCIGLISLPEEEQVDFISL